MKVAVITGGSRGIGRSAAIHTARQGFAVIITFNRDENAANEVVRSIEQAGGKAAALRLDVSDVSSFARFYDEVKERLGRWNEDGIDALVNNAGFGMFVPIENVKEHDFDALFGVHLKGPFFLTQTLLPLLRRGSQILNVTSATTRLATVGVAPYATFKGGLEVLTRYFAKEFGPRQIRANAISPGAIRTELAGGLTPEFEKLLAGGTALGRVGEPDDVGRTIASLLGPEHTWINGQSIELSGGYQL